MLDETAKGVFTIAATPFLPDGAVDFESVDRMVEAYVERGATGLTILGIMGEAGKLSEQSEEAGQELQEAEEEFAELQTSVDELAQHAESLTLAAAAVREAADETIRKLQTAMRTRAGEIGVG